MDTDPIEPDQPDSPRPDLPEPSRPEPFSGPAGPAAGQSAARAANGEPTVGQAEGDGQAATGQAATGQAATGQAVTGSVAHRPPVPPARTSTHIVYLDPKLDRPVSPYSPEGEIRMFGEFAAGLSRRGAMSRWMGIALMLVVLTPIVLSLLAVITHW